METVLNRIADLYQSKGKASRGKLKYERLYKAIKSGIIGNQIPPGLNLPPTRVLGEALQLSRTTVNRAYELLRLEGYIESHVGSGHQVKALSAASTSYSELTGRTSYPALSELGSSFLKNISLINSTDDNSIAFRPGLPPLDIFPVNRWKNLSNLYWRYIKTSALSYSPSAGLLQLKKNISAYLNLSRNIQCDPRQIIIVSGSLQSLYLVGSALLNPGDKVVMENPTFPNVYSIFKGLRADITSLPIDASGMDIAQLQPKSQNTTKLIHTTPSCHYPSGTRMTETRRREILKMAGELNAFVIENDYEHEVHNYKAHIPSIFSLDKEQRTIYLSTFNRLMHPSIRIGYMVLPPYLVDAVEALLKHSHRFVPPATQVVLNEFIEKKYLYKHVQNIVKAAEERKVVFENAFREAFKDRMTLHPGEARSLHILAKIENGKRDWEFVKALADGHIVAHAYSKCFTTPEKEQGLILGYTSVRPSKIPQKVEQMATILKRGKFV